jgi:hypothetical protein
MSSNPPPKGSFTWIEGFQDFPELLNLANEGKVQFSPAPKTGAGWSAALGFADGSIAAVALADYDRVKAGPVNLDLAISIVGIKPDGFLGHAVALGKKIAAQAKD